MKDLFLGIDIGSTTLKAALIDDNYEIIETLYTRTKPDKVGFVNCISRCSDCGACSSGSMKAQISKFLKKSNFSFKDIKTIGITGSQVVEDTQQFIPYNFQISEISAHISGAQFFFPSCKAILDVGGQDSKAMLYKEKMWLSKMSDICAAGTGSFLDTIANKLNISVEEIAKQVDFNSELEFSSVCAVLGATSINKFKNRYPLGQILAGACKAQSRTIMSGVGELLSNYKGDIVFQGGVSSNSAVVRYLQEITQQNILVPKFNQVMGAIGTAILACQNSIGQIKALTKKKKEKTIEEDKPLKAQQMRAKLTLKEFLSKDDRPLVWRNLFYPVEILNALGAKPFTLETYSALFARNQKKLKEHLDKASQRGFKAETCSFLRVLEGMSLPKPDFIISTSAPCGQAERILKDLAQKYEINDKSFTVSIPSHNRESAVLALADELELSVELLEKATGLKMKLENLQKACEASNEAREYSENCNFLRAKYAGIVKGSDLAYHSIIFSPFWGRSELVDIQKALYEEMLEKSQSFKKPSQSRHRIIFLHLPPFYSNKLLNYIEDTCNTDILMEEVNYTGWKPLDPVNPYYSIAERLLFIGFINQEERIKAIKTFVTENNIDGILAYNHGFGRCSMLDNVFMQALKAELSKERKAVPILTVDGDCLDASIDPCSTYTKLNAFFEALNMQKFGNILGYREPALCN